LCGGSTNITGCERKTTFDAEDSRKIQMGINVHAWHSLFSHDVYRFTLIMYKAGYRGGQQRLFSCVFVLSCVDGRLGNGQHTCYQ